MVRTKSGLETAKLATVFICDQEGTHRGQGLLLFLNDEGAVVLTCHHIVGPLGTDNIYFKVSSEDGSGLEGAISGRYDKKRSRPEKDAVVLRADAIRIKNNPLLLALNPSNYAGALRAVGLTYLQPRNFSVKVGPSTPLELDAVVPCRLPSPPARYCIPDAFRLEHSSDAREGISGAVIFCEGGVLGLAHFARGESPVAAREVYLVPLSVWADDWPALSELVRPLVWDELTSGVGGFQVMHSYQIRPSVRDFVGRENEIRVLVKALRGGAIACISGMGGVGKTELALKTAEKLRTKYPDGQLFLDMHGTDAAPLSPSDALSELLRAFGGPYERWRNDVNKLSKLYHSWLSGKRVLILLDNVANRDQIKLLIPPQSCGLLITSRDRLALEGMKGIHLEQMAPGEAQALLVRMSERTPADLAARICSLCGHLPLAIRAAGSQLNVTADLAPEAYAERLRDERTRLKEIGTEGVDTGVEASFNLSYASLLPETARVFTELSVFPASFDAASEEVVCEDAGHAHLSNLVRRSLASYDNEAGRYRLHDLMRLFAARRLTAADREVASKRHAALYASALRDYDQLYVQGGQLFESALQRFDADWDNIKAGQAWAKDHMKKDSEAASLCSDYARAGINLLGLRLPPLQRIGWFESGLAAARHMGNCAAEADHLKNIGGSYADAGEYDQAIRFLDQALAVTREEGSDYLFADLLGEAGHAYFQAGNIRGALEYYNRWLVNACRLNHHLGQCQALRSIGNAYFELSETGRAIEFYQQSLLLARNVNDRRGEIATLSSLGDAYAGIGETRRAIESYQQALDSAREVEDYTAVALLLNDLGDIHLALGEASLAIELYEQRLAISRRTGDHCDECRGLVDMGNAYACLGKSSLAIELHEQALSLARRIGDSLSEGEALSSLGNIYCDMGEYRRAIELHDRELAINRSLRDKRAESATLSNLGNAYASKGEIVTAIGLYEQALGLARDIEDRCGEVRTLGNLGNAYADMGQIQQAVKVLEKSVRLARRIGDRQGEYQSLKDIGTIYVEEGKPGAALEYHESALKLAVGLGDLLGQANSLYDLSQVLEAAGEKDRAVSYAESAVELYSKIENPGVSEALHHLRRLRGETVRVE